MIVRCVVLAGVVLAAASFGSAPANLDWVTYGGNLQSTNDATTASFAPASSSVLKQRWFAKLDGPVYAPVLVESARGIRRLFVETEANTVYSLNATTGRILWRHSLGPIVTTKCASRFGITSAPAIDEKRNRLYVIGSSGVLQALSLSTGSPVAGWRVRVVDRPAVEYVWSSVRLVGSTAYVATAGGCEDPNASYDAADGDLYAVDVVSRRIVHSFDVVPGPHNLGGIWGWGGVSVTSDGTLYTATGNAIVKHGNLLIEAQPHAERVLALSPNLKLLRASSVPPRAPTNLGDEDFGGTPLLFQPSGCRPLLALNSKDGRTLVYDRATLKLVWSARIGPTGPDDPFLGQPSWDLVNRQIVVAHAQFGAVEDLSNGLAAYRPSGNCSSFTRQWTLNIGGGPQPPPLIAGGIVFATAPPVGAVYAVDAKNGSIVWSAKTGSVVAPVATDGRSIYIAGVDGVVHSFVEVSP